MESIPGLRASEHLQLLTEKKQNIHTVDLEGMQSESPKVEDYMSQYKDVFTGEGRLDGQLPPRDRQEYPAGPATYTESANCPQRTSKTRIGQIVKYWSDSKGRYTNWVGFSSGGHSKDEWERQPVHWPKTLKLTTTKKSLPFTHNRWCTASPIKGLCVHSTCCEKWVLTRTVAVMQLLSEHHGAGIASCVCHSEYHQLQKNFRE